MSIRNMNLVPWLAVLFCLSRAPVVKATDASAPANTPHSRVTAPQPKLPEQDIWGRWKLAHDRHKAAKESRSMPVPASASQSSESSRDTGKLASPDQPIK